MKRDNIKLFFICIGVDSGPNTTPYRRALYLVNSYDVMILCKSEVDLTIAEKAKAGVFRCPCHSLHLDLIIFPFWVLYMSLLKRKRENIRIAYTTYHNICVLSGCLCKLFGLRWLLDLWDHPKLAIMDRKKVPGLRAKIEWLYAYILYYLSSKTIGFADKIIIALHPDSIKPYVRRKQKVIPICNGIGGDVVSSIRRKTLTQELPGEGQAFSIVYVGHIRLDRGLDVMMAAFSKLRDMNIKLILIGFMEKNREIVYSDIQRYALADKVEIYENLPHDKVMSRLVQAEAAIYPFSDKEELKWIYPIKIFEYMSAGLPIISSDLPGVKSILADDAYYFVPDNAGSLYDAIIRCYNERDNANLIKEQHTKKVMEYLWDNVQKPINKILVDFLC